MAAVLVGAKVPEFSIAATGGKFRDKMQFPFDLGSDEDHAIADLFGVWKQKNMYGRN